MITTCAGACVTFVLIQIGKQQQKHLYFEGAAVPVQGSEAHQALQVGLGVDVPLPHRVQLEA